MVGATRYKLSAVICGRSQQVQVVGVSRYPLSESAGTYGRSQQETSGQQLSVVGASRYKLSAVICGRSQQVQAVGVSRYPLSESAGTYGRSQQLSVVGASRYQCQWSEPADTSGRSQHILVVGASRY